jgi:hypothetical protein
MASLGKVCRLLGSLSALLGPAGHAIAATDPDTGGMTGPDSTIQSEKATPPTDEATDQAAPPPSLLAVDTAHTPRVTIAWTRADERREEIIAQLDFGVDADRISLGHNITAYAAIGGTRIGKGAGHPKGSVIRTGLYKRFGPRAFFEDLKPGSDIEVRLEGVHFNQPVHAIQDSAVMHLKFNPDDLVSCGLPPGARECFNLVSTTDTLNGRTIPGEDTRMGALDGSGDGDGSVRVLETPANEVGFAATIPYALLRHLQDPWESDLPGTFLEPIHFHIEIEVLPKGVEPLDWEALRIQSEQAIKAQIGAPQD